MIILVESRVSMDVVPGQCHLIYTPNATTGVNGYTICQKSH